MWGNNIKRYYARAFKTRTRPKRRYAKPVLRADVLKFEDLKEGMILTGTVRNVTDFGAFVDVGVKHDGLVHISQLSNSFVKILQM